VSRVIGTTCAPVMASLASWREPAEEAAASDCALEHPAATATHAMAREMFGELTGSVPSSDVAMQCGSRANYDAVPGDSNRSPGVRRET
jgi:hypothetical protein